jgi:hypothetical protein
MITRIVNVAAGKPSVIELRFRVEDGFHINSHRPKDELLIPTELKLTPEGFKIEGEDYQAGVPFRLMGAKGELLDVYQGEFVVKVGVVVPKGNWTLMGLLRYQACDNAACLPPRSMPVMVAITGE